MKGYLHVYTGDGKGKTTAALGLALRAAGAGLHVFIGQFVKGMPYSEFNAIKRFSDYITLKQYGRDCFIQNKPDAKDVEVAQNGLAEIKEILRQGTFDLVIMDEANIATYFGLFTVDSLIEAIEGRDRRVEVVVTGRKADPKLMAAADLVTVMDEVKHPYQKGIEAREGIEF